MDWLKNNWWLIVFVFGIGGYFTKLQIEVDKIETKLDISVWQKKMQDDSIKAYWEDYKDSLHSAKQREKDSLDNYYKKKYSNLTGANTSPSTADK